MNREKIRKLISDGQAVLGIELGSTRIKAVLIDDNHDPIASGSHTWQNRYEDGIWTIAWRMSGRVSRTATVICVVSRRKI